MQWGRGAAPAFRSPKQTSLGAAHLKRRLSLYCCPCRLTRPVSASSGFPLPPAVRPLHTRCSYLYSSLPRPLPRHIAPDFPVHPFCLSRLRTAASGRVHAMPNQRYERVRCLGLGGYVATAQNPSSHSSHDTRTNPRQVAAQDEDDSHVSSTSAQQWPPASPPPSFHSRASSPHASSRRVLAEDPAANDEDRTLADTFDSDSDDDDDNGDDRQRLMRGNPQSEEEPPVPGIQRRVTELPVFNTQAPSSGRVYGGGNGGVWANLSAKPTRGEDAEEKPPVRTASYLHSANHC